MKLKGKKKSPVLASEDADSFQVLLLESSSSKISPNHKGVLLYFG